MAVGIPLRRMTTSDKLRAMEQIWENLRSSPKVPSPSWHADVLRARERRIREGKSRFVDWPDAKRRIRERAR